MFSIASLPRLGRDLGREAGPALLRFKSRSRSFMAGDGPLPKPKPVDGSAVRVSPLESLPALERLMPFLRSFLSSRYILAPSESGKGEDAGSGTSAPFCRSISATGKGFRGRGVDGLGGVVADSCPDGTRMLDADGPEECPKLPGDAGSAATSARKTACVDRDRSCTLGFARCANACSTF